MLVSRLQWWMAEKVLCGRAFLFRHRSIVALAVIGVLLFISTSPAYAYAPGSFKGELFQKACKGIRKYQEGTKGGGEGFSALLAAVAGIGAIISAAVGGYRMAWTLIVVALGSMILGNFVDTFLPGTC